MSKLSMAHLLNTVATDGIYAYETLVAEGYHPKIVRAKIQAAGRRGYLEHGVVDHRGWLTVKGAEYNE